MWRSTSFSRVHELIETHKLDELVNAHELDEFVGNAGFFLCDHGV
jgi:hypothetical protein